MTGNISSVKNLFADKTSSLEKIKDVSDKIFSVLNTDGDDYLSVAEQLSGGLTFAGKKLSKKDFTGIYVDFAEKTLNTKACLEDFNEQPRDVLTPSLREELIKRLELARLTRDNLYKEDEEFKKLKKDIKEASWLNFRLVHSLLRAATPYDNSKVQDGKIGFFKQGSLGDCWFLAQLMVYASSKDGENNIRKRIKTNPDGTYTVTLQHPNLRYQHKEEKYTITKNDLANRIRTKKISSGDIDVQILELAFESYLKKHLPKDYYPSDFNDFFLEGSGTNQNYAGIKRLLVHRAFGYTDTPKVYVQSNDGKFVFERKIIALDSYDGSVVTKPFENYKKKKYNNFSDAVLTNSYNPLGCIADTLSRSEIRNLNGGNPLMVTNHSYSLSKISLGHSYYNNPHNSAKNDTLSNDSFNGHLRDIYYFPKKNISDSKK